MGPVVRRQRIEPGSSRMSTTPPRRPARQKVPAFARYEGTSAWHKDRRRVRAYALFKAAQKQPQAPKSPTT